MKEADYVFLITKANELISTQDELINNQNKQLESYAKLVSKQDDIIKLLKMRIDELLGESEI